MLAWIFDECRKGQIFHPLGRYNFDTPLLAAGCLTCLSAAMQNLHSIYGTLTDFAVSAQSCPELLLLSSHLQSL